MTAKKIFSRFTLEHGFLQVVDEPTRNQFIIDWIFVDNSNLLANVNCIENFSTSDHCNIIFDRLIPSSKLMNLERNKNVLNYKAANWPAINAMLSNINWRFIENVDFSMQDAWKFLYDIIYKSFDLYFPIKTQKRHLKGNLPCEIKKLKAKKLNLWSKLKINPNDAKLKRKYMDAARTLWEAINTWRTNHELHIPAGS